MPQATSATSIDLRTRRRLSCSSVFLGCALMLAFTSGCGRPGAGNTSDQGSEFSTSDNGETTEIIEAGEEASASFAPDPDLPVSLCDPFGQDCPADHKCVPWDHKCVPVLGDHKLGEPCIWHGLVEGTDDCDASSYCWNAVEVDGEYVGTCHALCGGTNSAPECPELSSCLINDDGLINVCVWGCDPVGQDCGPGLACYWTEEAFLCAFTTGDLPTGETCDAIDDCAAGLICMDAAVLPQCAGASCCTSYCDLGLPAPCAQIPGTDCVPFLDPATTPPVYEHVGVCIF